MLINPILIIVCAAALLFACIFCVVNRPTKPIFTGVIIFFLLLFSLMTLFINVQLSTPPVAATTTGSSQTIFSVIVSFITATEFPTQQQLTEVFSLFCVIDVVLVVAVCVCMLFDVRSLISKNKKFRGKQ